MNRFLRKNGLVIAGGTIQGLGMGLFLFPHAIPSGGAGGLAVLLNHFFVISLQQIGHLHLSPGWQVSNLLGHLLATS